MKNVGLLVGTIVGSLVFVIGIAIAFSQNSAQNSQTGLSEPEDPAIVVGDARHTTGPEDARITIVEFSDLECPACKAVQPLLKQVLAEYPEDVRLVYRHFPLNSIHPYAQIAAQASEAAAEQEKFWEFHDVLFQKQQEWAALGSQGEVIDAFVEYAGDLGIDTSVFRERITSDEIRQLVLADVANASTLRISSTPTLFVNNQRVPAPGQLLTIVQSLMESQN